MFKHPAKPSAAVVIPAYNEERTIARTLNSLVRDMKHGEFEIVVVCNGCLDRTADVARSACPSARVLQTEIASKTAALNLGLAATKVTPVVFLDADIKTSAAAVRDLVSALEAAGHDLAFGKAQFNISKCTGPVREFYHAWQMNPYFDGGKVGGFFAVSEAGLERLGSFPVLTNDDEFVRRKLSASAVFVPAATYIVEPPRTLSSLIQVRSRVYRGNSELFSKDIPIAANQQRRNASRFITRLVCAPQAWAGAVVFAFVALSAHARNKFRQGHTRWEQDQTARVAQS